MKDSTIGLIVKMGVIIAAISVSWGVNNAEIGSLKKDMSRIEVKQNSDDTAKSQFYERFFKMEATLESLGDEIRSLKKDLSRIESKRQNDDTAKSQFYERFFKMEAKLDSLGDDVREIKTDLKTLSGPQGE